MKKWIFLCSALNINKINDAPWNWTKSYIICVDIIRVRVRANFWMWTHVNEISDIMVVLKIWKMKNKTMLSLQKNLIIFLVDFILSLYCSAILVHIVFQAVQCVHKRKWTWYHENRQRKLVGNLFRSIKLNGI